MTSDLLKNINFINILSRQSMEEGPDTLSIKNHSISLNEEKLNFKNNFYSAGIHPWESALLNNNKIRLINSLKITASKDRCIAIGETGLDKINGPKIETQMNNFHLHIDISESLNKPLIIHCVKAYSEILQIHKSRKVKMPWIIHDFNQNGDFIKSIQDKNIYISLGKTFFLNNSSKIIKNVNDININYLVFETDEMELKVSEIYKKFSRIRNIKKRELEKAVTKNYEEIFMN